MWSLKQRVLICLFVTIIAVNSQSTEGLFGWLNPKSYVRFYIWTRDSPVGIEVPLRNLTSLLTNGFEPSHPTKVILHGVGGSGRSPEHLFLVIQAYLYKGGANVITVDFGALVNYLVLPLAPGTPPLVGRIVAKFLDTLSEITPLEKFHLIGFSIGAHVAGYAGQHVTTGKIGRITALDAGNPGFQFVDDDERLSPDDATMVDAIHTDAGRQLIFAWGIDRPVGHADFYPNGGTNQPNCPSVYGLHFPSNFCDHTRSILLFAESIVNDVRFMSCPVSNWTQVDSGMWPCSRDKMVAMGEPLPDSARGVYFLRTRGTHPFSMGYGSDSTEANEV